MKVNEEAVDGYGRDCTEFDTVSVTKIHEWLEQQGWGGKYAIVLDCSRDEYVPMDKPIRVYDLSEIVKEALHYLGKYHVDKVLKDMGWKE